MTMAVRHLSPWPERGNYQADATCDSANSSDGRGAGKEYGLPHGKMAEQRERLEAQR
jgi:hypothetical protein